MENTTLAGLGVGNDAIVRGVSGEPALCARLLDLGFVRGTRVRVLSASRGVLRVRIRSCDLSLRSATAAMINVAAVKNKDI